MAVWLGVRLAMAHGDTHEMVKAVTEELRSRPRDPDLYIRRAELHRRHGDFDLALADYETASRYASPPPASLDLMRGLLFLEAKWPFAARAYLDRYLGRETNHVVALAARARANLELKDRDAAIRDFDAAIRHSSEPRPELYIERAQALVTAEGSRLQEAVDGLDEGMRRLGPVVTLQLQAIDLLLRMRQTNAALSRVDRIIEQSPRKETWLARRGEILMQAGRWAEANEAFTNAIAQLATLPPARRSVPAIQELEKRLRQAAAEAAGHHP
jgi:tetratricopeptide (TPR) repeat protein